MSLRLSHVSDIHWRSLSRHKEYTQVFEEFFAKCVSDKVDGIVCTGDIYHTKNQNISPEVIEKMTWMFKTMASIAPVYVILGNHDLSMQNLTRQDTISPIVDAIGNPLIKLYKRSGVYPIRDGYNFCVYSCTDQEHWETVAPIRGDVNIGLYHGSIAGAITDEGWSMDGEIDIKTFDEYNVVMLGDIHKFQFLTRDKRIAYPGSMIPQNFSEISDKGFLLWDIERDGTFKVQFQKLFCPDPFITINWEGSLKNTLKNLVETPSGAHYRIQSTTPIHQVELKQLYNEIKTQKKATDIVFDVRTAQNANVVNTKEFSLQKQDLSNLEVQMKLFKSHLKNTQVNKIEWDEIETVLKRCLEDILSTETIRRNIKWHLNALEFDNLFCYGENNRIDFSKLSGITGIFAPNRTGKSSLVGSIFYTIFNTADRNIVKNLFAINEDKDYCLGKAFLTIGSKEYVIERQSVKKEDKKGLLSAATNANFYEADTDESLIDDLNGLQRRDTDKDIRNNIGTLEDFLITSFCAQGEMESFIKEGSTKRKLKISKFLGLDIFEKINTLVKAESDVLKKEIKNFSDRDWGAEISDRARKKKECEQKIKDSQNQLEENSSSVEELSVEIAKLKSLDVISESKIKALEGNITKLETAIGVESNKLSATKKNIEELQGVMTEAQQEKSLFSEADLKEQVNAKNKLEKELASFKMELEKQNLVLENQKKSLNLLKEVPCGDQFPECKFIKDSHLNKSKIESQEQSKNDVYKKIENLTEVLDKNYGKILNEKIKNLSALQSKESSLKLKISEKNNEKQKHEYNNRTLEDRLAQEKKKLEEYKKKTVNNDCIEKLASLEKELSDLKSLNASLDTIRISQSELKGKLEREIESLSEEKEKFVELKKKWKVYDLILQSTSKTGIPNEIIHSQIPIINSELSKILDGIVDFNLELESDLESNSLEIYMNNGRRKRLIETGSGMEKFISSLATRVAFTNLSTLPKTDMLIIDEGFSCLDDENSRAVCSLLQNLKAWFKNIIIITHQPSIKDCVDNLIEITKEGGYSRVFV